MRVQQGQEASSQRASLVLTVLAIVVAVLGACISVMSVRTSSLSADDDWLITQETAAAQAVVIGQHITTPLDTLRALAATMAVL